MFVRIYQLIKNCHRLRSICHYSVASSYVGIIYMYIAYSMKMGAISHFPFFGPKLLNLASVTPNISVF